MAKRAYRLAAGKPRRLVLYPALAVAGALALVFIGSAWERPAGRPYLPAVAVPVVQLRTAQPLGPPDAPTQPAPPTPGLPAPDRMKDNTRVYFDIPYDSAPGVDPEQLSLDVYTPEGAAARPVVVFVHGGGWSGGDKSEIGQKDRAMIAAGYVFASINYRLLPSGAHPVNVQDVARALAWIHRQIARYGGSPDRIFVIGHSAGAQLSALLATDERYLAAEGEKLAILKGVVLLDSNAYDIPRLMPHLADDGNVYVTAFGKQQSPLWQDASPVTHVAAGKGIPPFLVVHANNDPSRAEQAESMARALRAAGIRADLLDIPERDHGSLCDQIGTTGDRATAVILDFFSSLR